MANMENARNFLTKAQGNFGDMTRPGQDTMSDAKGAFADMTSTGGKNSMAGGDEERPMDAEDKVVADTGGWMYRDLGDGRIEIMQAPQGSKMAGKILDPKMIDSLSDAGKRARAQRAYDSIQRVMSGQAPLKPAGGGKKAPSTTGSASSPSASADVGGAVDRPAPGSLSEPIRDTLTGKTGPRRPSAGGR